MGGMAALFVADRAALIHAGNQAASEFRSAPADQLEPGSSCLRNQARYGLADGQRRLNNHLHSDTASPNAKSCLSELPHEQSREVVSESTLRLNTLL